MIHDAHVNLGYIGIFYILFDDVWLTGTIKGN